MAKFKAHLVNGQVAHVEDTARDGQALLQGNQPLKATEVTDSGGTRQVHGVVWVPQSAVVWVEQTES